MRGLRLFAPLQVALLFAPLLACATAGGGGTDDVDAANSTVDAPPGAIDAPPGTIDAPVGPVDAPMQTTITLSQSNATNIVAGNAVACSNSATGVTRTNSFYRVFRLADHGVTRPFTAQRVDFGVEEATAGTGTSQAVQIRLHRLTGAFVTANLANVAGQTVTVNNGSGVVLPVALSPAPVLQASDTLVVELSVPDGMAASNIFFPGSNTAGETGASYVKSADCSINEPQTMASLGFPTVHLVMTVTGAADPGGAVGADPGDAEPAIGRGPVPGDVVEGRRHLGGPGADHRQVVGGDGVGRIQARRRRVPGQRPRLLGRRQGDRRAPQRRQRAVADRLQHGVGRAAQPRHQPRRRADVERGLGVEVGQGQLVRPTSGQEVVAQPSQRPGITGEARQHDQADDRRVVDGEGVEGGAGLDRVHHPHPDLAAVAGRPGPRAQAVALHDLDLVARQQPPRLALERRIHAPSYRAAAHPARAPEPVADVAGRGGWPERVAGARGRGAWPGRVA
ncbi:MAG: hypothetical protein HS111_19600 [Kofleriaceae bacterium]|nr:hypothetical protein [Kofleriaceae bacterium]